MKIFAFDSGIGGLTAIAPLLNASAGAEIHYLGDLANLPYGTKSPERVRQLTRENVAWMVDNLSQGEPPAFIVIACNTASAYVMTELEAYGARIGVPIFGVIEPGCRAAIAAKPNRVIVIATAATVASRAYSTSLAALGYAGPVIEKACPLFVPLVEEGMVTGPAAEWIARNYLDAILEPGDTVILGCTHYPYLIETLTKLYPTARWIDAGGALVRDQRVAAALAKPAGTAASTLHLHFTDKTATRERVESFAQFLGISPQGFSLRRMDPVV